MQVRKTESSPALPILIVLFVFTFAVTVFALVSWRSAQAKIYGSYKRVGDHVSLYENVKLEGNEYMGYIAQLEAKDADLAKAIGERNRYEEVIGIKFIDQFEDKLAPVKNELEEAYKREGDADTLVVLIRRLAQKGDALADQLRTAAGEKQKAEQSLEEARKQLEDKTKQYTERIQTFQDDLVKKNNETNELRGSLEAKIGELQNRVVDLNSQNERDREKAKKELIVANREKDRLANALAEVKATKIGSTVYDVDSAEPSGVLLNVDKTGKSCMVNIGQKHGAKVGLQFRVYETGPGGKRIEKGLIEIKKLYPNYSFAGILSVKDELNPILPDDVALSPIFKRGAPSIFVFETDFERVEKSRLKEKIEKFGNKVEDAVTAQTDFVVINEQPKEMAMEAKAWGVRIIRAIDVAKVLGTD